MNNLFFTWHFFCGHTKVAYRGLNVNIRFICLQQSDSQPLKSNKKYSSDDDQSSEDESSEEEEDEVYVPAKKRRSAPKARAPPNQRSAPKKKQALKKSAAGKKSSVAAPKKTVTKPVFAKKSKPWNNCIFLNLIFRGHEARFTKAI